MIDDSEKHQQPVSSPIRKSPSELLKHLEQGKKKKELENDCQSLTRDFIAAWSMKIYLLHDGTHLHTNTYSPVNHGGVASVHVDGNAVPRFGIPSTTDSMQTLQDPDRQNPNQWTENLNNKVMILIFWRVKLTATKSTFFTVALGMVNGSHRSCERNLSVRILLFSKCRALYKNSSQ